MCTCLAMNFYTLHCQEFVKMALYTLKIACAYTRVVFYSFLLAVLIYLTKTLGPSKLNSYTNLICNFFSNASQKARKLFSFLKTCILMGNLICYQDMLSLLCQRPKTTKRSIMSFWPFHSTTFMILLCKLFPK